MSGGAVGGPPSSGAAVDRMQAALAQAAHAVDADFLNVASALGRGGEDHQDRNLGIGPAAVMAAWQMALTASEPPVSAQLAARRFIQANPASVFFHGGDPPGADDQVPLAQDRIRH